MSETTDREIVTSRLISAPRERVWEAFTNPEQIDKWWGPNGFTNITETMKVRPGGTWRFHMHGPDGTDWPNLISYLEVVENERLVFDHGDFEDPVQFRNTITFEDQDGKTLVTMQAVFPTAEIRNLKIEKYGAIEGGKQTLAHLDEFITNQL